MDNVRLGVNLNRATADALIAYATDHNISITEAIRRMVSLNAFLENEMRAGKQIIICGKKRRDERILALI